QCKNNLKQMGLAYHNYHDTYNHFPRSVLLKVDVSTGKLLVSGVSWDIASLPYLDQAPLYNLYNSNLAPYDPLNATAVANVVPVYLCPSTPRAANLISYTIPAGTVLASGFPGTPQYSMTCGAQDYTTFDGVRGDFANLAYANYGGATGNRHGYGTWSV